MQQQAAGSRQQGLGPEGLNPVHTSIGPFASSAASVVRASSSGGQSPPRCVRPREADTWAPGKKCAVTSSENTAGGRRDETSANHSVLSVVVTPSLNVSASRPRWLRLRISSGHV